MRENKVEKSYNPMSIKESIFLQKKKNKELPIKKTLGLDCITGKFYHTFIEETGKASKTI